MCAWKPRRKKRVGCKGLKQRPRRKVMGGVGDEVYGDGGVSGACPIVACALIG